MNSAPPAHERILHQEQTRLFGRVVSARLMLLPVLAAALIGLAWVQPLGWRTVLLLTLSVVAPTFFVFEWLRYRRHGLSPNALPLNITAATLGQLSVAAATGGLSSPFIYGAVPIAAAIGTFLDRRWRRALAALQFVGVWALALASELGGLPHFATTVLSWSEQQAGSLPPSYVSWHAVVLSAALLAACHVGQALMGVFRETLRRELSAREELLAAHGERVRELTSLSAEIAHELKNPLASVKGLSALLSNNLSDERGRERLAVLRREVDRMQSVLDEFLNFSRPLVPLAIVPSDVARIGQEVAALHEGLAQQGRVGLECRGHAAVAHCDPRKVKQILINLVQNGLEASPAATSLAIECELCGPRVRVRVLDEGPGLDEQLGNVFEAGVSSKAGGAGLGLTIARALARQHGGELTLSSRPEGGAVAELQLPVEAMAGLPEAPRPEASA